MYILSCHMTSRISRHHQISVITPDTTPDLLDRRHRLLVRNLHYGVRRRDQIRLIGRILSHTTAEKAGPGECPKKKGIPPKN